RGGSGGEWRRARRRPGVRTRRASSAPSRCGPAWHGCAWRGRGGRGCLCAPGDFHGLACAGGPIVLAIVGGGAGPEVDAVLLDAAGRAQRLRPADATAVQDEV